MRIRWIENVSLEDAVKSKDFLERLSSSFKVAEGRIMHTPLELFLESSLQFHFSPLQDLADFKGRNDLVIHEEGSAYIEIPPQKERFLLAFHWNQLYQQLPLEAISLVSDYLSDHPPQENLYRCALKYDLRLPSVESGVDLMKHLTHATWQWLSQFPESAREEKPQFVVYLPLSFYPYLIEPSTIPHLDNIRDQLSRVLSIRVVLTHRLRKEGVLIFEEDLHPLDPVVPLYFLGVDEEGSKKFFVYLKEPEGVLALPTASLTFVCSWWEIFWRKARVSAYWPLLVFSFAQPIAVDLWRGIKPWGKWLWELLLRICSYFDRLL